MHRLLNWLIALWTCTWTTPYTWDDGRRVKAQDMNIDVRNNLNALKNPPSAHYELNEATDYWTNAVGFVDVDPVKLALTVVTTGGDVMVHFHGTVAATSRVLFDIDVDGVRIGDDDGIIMVQSAGTDLPVSFTRLIALAAGSHTFKLQWKLNTGDGYIFSGAGTANKDIHPQFWVREVS